MHRDTVDLPRFNTPQVAPANYRRPSFPVIHRGPNYARRATIFERLLRLVVVRLAVAVATKK